MTTITEEQKTLLQDAGYFIENMEEAWGTAYPQQYRWLNRLWPDETGVVQFSEEDAWADAHQYHQQVIARFDSLAGMYAQA
jgi:hypothetical protein